MNSAALLRLLVPAALCPMLGDVAAAQDWSLMGNAGTNPAVNFLGTTDAQPLTLRTSNQERLRITDTGNVNIGTNSAASRLSIFSNVPDLSVGMLHLGVTAPFAQPHRVLTATKRNAANTGQLDWTLELEAGDAPSLELFRVARIAGTPPEFLRRALRVGWDGRVSIGDGTRPGEQLVVNGNVRFNCADRCVAGGGLNRVTSGVVGATIAGGGKGFPFPAAPHSVADNYGTVGGGLGNRAGDNAGTVEDKVAATVSGGSHNTASGAASSVGGGEENSSSGDASTIGGGGQNQASGGASTVAGGVLNRASGRWSTVSGGAGNRAAGEKATVGGGSDHAASGELATVAGGFNNGAVSYGSTVGGGAQNQAGDTANPGQSGNATVAGGASNTAAGEDSTVSGGSANFASGKWSAVGGGRSNAATGFHSSVPGGEGNLAEGSHSFAAGHDAQARHFGAFVWADSTGFAFESTRDNQFNVRAGGGTRVFSDSQATIGVELLPGGNAWSALSDRGLKENFIAVDGREILDRLSRISILEWNLKSQNAAIRHLGPAAQDFHAAFGLGESERHISTSDADGVALIAIQELYRLSRESDRNFARLKRELTEKERALHELRSTNAALHMQVETLQQRTTSLEARLATLEQVSALRRVQAEPGSFW